MIEYGKHHNLNNENILAQSFSSKIISELANTGKSISLSNILNETDSINDIPENITLRAYFDDLYKRLLDNYRNEYIFKNLIVNKILLGRHSLNTSAMLTEFRVLNSKADVLFLNGNSHIYEIKTEYDCLDKLDKQIKDYQQFSEFVTVITTKSLGKKALKFLPTSVGLIELTKECTFRSIRKAISGIEKISKDVIFDSFRKEEYLECIQRNIGFIPDVPNTKIHSECKSLFSTLSKETINKELLLTMKNRFTLRTNKNFIENIPSSLRAVAISGCISNNKCDEFLTTLSNKIKYVL